MRMYQVALLGLLCLEINGCAHTHDVSSTPEYKPWIGKTVNLCGSEAFSVYAPKWGQYFIESTHVRYDYPILGELREGNPVVIEAVKKTEGRYPIGLLHYTHVRLVLSIDHPKEKDKRIRVLSELYYVEPFKDKKGHIIDGFLEQEPMLTEPKKTNPNQ